jgi:dTDP-4-dehydrorhamnose reductase
MESDNLKVWVIGASGMLAQDLIEVLIKQKISYYATDMECNIIDSVALTDYVQGKDITHIVNCAAYTAVDKAEDEPEKAYALNALGPKNIADVAKVIGAQMVHISTDYVFEGTNESGYLEDDPVNPISVYGETKAIGETFVQECLDEFYIVRTAWLYGKHGNNFVNTMMRLMNERDEISVINDQHGSPTYAHDLATYIIYLINNDISYGIYHYTNDGQITWYDFANEIYQQGKERNIISGKCIINPVTSEQYSTKAVRPKWSKLVNIKNKNSGLYKNWFLSLKDFYHHYE